LALPQQSGPVAELLVHKGRVRLPHPTSYIESHPDWDDDTGTEEDMTMTSQDVIAVLGPVDRALIAEIVATGAEAGELAEAWAWVNSDEALIGEGRRLPKGRVAELVDLLSAEDEDWEE
jgi:hypothetical protein